MTEFLLIASEFISFTSNLTKVKNI